MRVSFLAVEIPLSALDVCCFAVRGRSRQSQVWFTLATCVVGGGEARPAASGLFGGGGGGGGEYPPSKLLLLCSKLQMRSASISSTADQAKWHNGGGKLDAGRGWIFLG